MNGITERDLRELLHPFHHVRAQREDSRLPMNPHQTLNLPVP